MQIFIRTVLFVIIFKLVYIFLREYFQTNGCVICRSVADKGTDFMRQHTHEIDQLVSAMEWVSTVESKDVTGFEF